MQKETLVTGCVCLVSAVLLCMGLHYTLTDGIEGRFLYPFSHANVFHLLANVWCVYLIRKCAIRDSVWMWVLAYMIAVCVPNYGVAVEGLSGVCYAVLGIMSWMAAERIRYHVWMIPFLAVGFIIPQFAGFVHLWCYSMGVLIGLLWYGES